MNFNPLRKIRAYFAETPNRIVLFFVVVFSMLFSIHVLRVIGDRSDLAPFDLFSSLERSTYDHKLRSRVNKREIQNRTDSRFDSDIAIVGVDEASVAALGRFPFRRSVYAQLVNRLRELGASVVAFDMIFSEQQENYIYDDLTDIQNTYGSQLKRSAVGRKVLQDIDQRLKRENDDEVFARAIRGDMPVILGMFFARFGRNAVDYSREQDEGSWDVPVDYEERLSLFRKKYLKQIEVADFKEDGTNVFYVGKDAVLPIPKLVKAAASIPEFEVPLAFFDTSFDEDGILRKVPLVASYREKIYPSLPFAAVIAHLKADVQGKVTSNGLKQIPMSEAYHDFGHLVLLPSTKEGKKYYQDRYGVILPSEASGGLHVNYRGPQNSFPRYELIDVLEGNIPQDAFRDKIVFIGATSKTLKDNKATPFGADFPGVEVHANVAHSLLTRSFLVRGSLFVVYGFFFITIGALLFGFIINLLNPVVSSVLTATVVAGILILDQRFFFANGIIIPSMIPAIQYVGILFGITIFKFVTADREKRFVETAFSRFVTGSVVKEILADEGELKMGGESRELTVLFADIERFTTLSERLEADVLCSLLNDIFTRFTRVILDNRGTLDKYMGDEIMCFWGAPLQEERHAELACETALKMMKIAREANADWEETVGEPLGLRIGINTGDMVVGNMGSEQVFDYTVIGDAVNLGSRLESVNRVYSTNVIVGKSTYESCKSKFLFRPLDCILVAGKSKAVEVFELIGAMDDVLPSDREWVDTFILAREAYAAKNWVEAKALFGTVAELKPEDEVPSIFLDRIEKLENNCADDWQGEWKVGGK